MKVCSICKIEKDLSCFNKNKSKKDGLSTDCRECARKYLEEYRSKNKEILTIKNRVFKENNRDLINSRNKTRYSTIHKSDPLFMEKKRKANSKYKANNKGKVNSDTAKRYTAKLQRCTITSKEDYKIIERVYKEANRLSILTGIKFHVDHIIPLQGELVSGLHVPLNLQILSEQENCSKHNSFIV